MTYNPIGLRIVIKFYREGFPEGFRNELRIAEIMEKYGYKLNGSYAIPRYIAHGQKYSIIEFIEGINITDLCFKLYKEKIGASEPFWMGLLWRIINWMEYFIKKTGYTVGDANPRNFILNESRGILYGIDFEEIIEINKKEKRPFLGAYCEFVYYILDTLIFTEHTEGSVKYLKTDTEFGEIFLGTSINTVLLKDKMQRQKHRRYYFLPEFHYEKEDLKEKNGTYTNKQLAEKILNTIMYKAKFVLERRKKFGRDHTIERKLKVIKTLIRKIKNYL